MKQFDTNGGEISDELSLFLYHQIQAAIPYLHATVESIDMLEDYLTQSPDVYRWYLMILEEYNVGNSFSVLGLWDDLDCFEDANLKRRINNILEEFVNVTLEQTYLFAQTQQRDIPTIEDLVEMLLRENDLITLLFRYITNFNHILF